MSYSSQFHMPGAYHFEGNPPSGSGPGLNAGIFRPPMSPSASSSVLNLAKSTGSLCSDVSMANTPPLNSKRKRARDDPRRESTPLAADWTAADLSATAYDAETPLERNGDRPPRYVLAGQIETPGARTLNPLEANMEDSVYSDVDYRRALGSKRSHLQDPETPGANGTAGGGEGCDLDATPQTPRSQGWGSFAFTVVGKVWDFCKGGAFRGFYAGGGKGYEWKGGDSTPPQAAAGGAEGGGDPWGSASDLPVGLNTPGAFPGAHYAPTPEYRDSSPPASTPRPAAKRRQISENGDELRKNWVMVSEDDDTHHPPPQQHQHQQQQQHLRPVASRAEKKRPSLAPQPRPSSRQQARPSGPMRRISIPVSRLGGTPASSSSSRRLPSSRISHAGSPGLTAREPASFAPPRSPVAAPSPSPSPSRRTFSPAASSRIPMPSGGGAGSSSANPFAPPRASASPRPSSRQSSMPSPAFGSSGTPGGGGGGGGSGHRRAASTAGARRTDADPVSNSPRLDAEAQRLAARKRAVERDTDARMDAFSARLRDMIRQGKEALGTTVEVDGTADDGGDEGWLDDE